MKNFRAWRQKRSLNQTQLGDKLGVDQATISRYERGEVEMTLTVVNAWADALKIEPQDFWTHPDAPRNELAALAHRIDAKAQAKALRVLREVLKEDDQP